MFKKEQNSTLQEQLEPYMQDTRLRTLGLSNCYRHLLMRHLQINQVNLEDLLNNGNDETASEEVSTHMRKKSQVFPSLNNNPMVSLIVKQVTTEIELKKWGTYLEKRYKHSINGIEQSFKGDNIAILNQDYENMCVGGYIQSVLMEIHIYCGPLLICNRQLQFCKSVCHCLQDLSLPPASSLSNIVYSRDIK